MIKNRTTKFELLWHLLIILAVTYTAIEAPLSYIFQTPIGPLQLWMDGVICILFTADIIYNIREMRAHIKKDIKRKRPITKKEKILLGVDLFASIPFDIISYAFGLHAGVKVFRMIRMVRLFRIIKIFSVVGHLNIVPRPVKFGIGALVAIIAIHNISCLWILANDFQIVDQVTEYNKALYWTVTTLTTIGYGDITPQTNIARLFTMVIMVLGVGVYGIVIGNVSRMLSNADKHKEKSREKIQDLTMFMRHYNVPRKLQDSTFDFYNHILEKRLSDNDQKIIGELPNALQNELKTYMNIKLIRNIPLFKNCSHNCLKHVAKTLKQSSMIPGEKVITRGEVGNEMFILGHGKVDVVKEKIITSLDEGSFFGEAALLEETVRNADIVAKSYCDIYRLEKNDFLNIIKQYPELLMSMKRVTGKKAA